MHALCSTHWVGEVVAGELARHVKRVYATRICGPDKKSAHVPESPVDIDTHAQKHMCALHMQ